MDLIFVVSQQNNKKKYNGTTFFLDTGRNIEILWSDKSSKHSGRTAILCCNNRYSKYSVVTNAAWDQIGYAAHAALHDAAQQAAGCRPMSVAGKAADKMVLTKVWDTNLFPAEETVGETAEERRDVDYQIVVETAIRATWRYILTEEETIKAFISSRLREVRISSDFDRDKVFTHLLLDGKDLGKMVPVAKCWYFTNVYRIIVSSDPIYKRESSGNNSPTWIGGC